MMTPILRLSEEENMGKAYIHFPGSRETLYISAGIWNLGLLRIIQ